MNRERFLGLFVDEARQHLLQANSRLADFSLRPQDPATLRDLMRHCHSLKGMAATMGFEPFVALAHRMEGLLQQLEGRPRMWSAELSPLFAAGLDRLSEWLERIGLGETPGHDAATQDLLARLDSQLTEIAPLANRVRGRQAATHDTPPVWSIILELKVSSSSPAQRVVATLKRVARLGRVLRVRPPQLPFDDTPVAIELQFDLSSKQSEAALKRRLEQLPGIARLDLQHIEPDGPVERSPLTRAAAWTRVNVETLDWVADTLRELAVQQQKASEGAAPVDANAARAAERARFLIKRLFDRVDELRLVPFVSVNHRLEPAVRDAARSMGLDVLFRIVGGEINLDRTLLERLVEPLRHLARNAVAHAFEAPAEREAAGKPASGSLTLTVTREREQLNVELLDDGRGMDPQALRAAAVKRGAIRPADANAMSDSAALRLAFLPAVTTRATADRLAGRGSGLDVAARALLELDSTLLVESTRGVGSRFFCSIPLRQAIVQALVFRRREEIYALPLRSVKQAVSVATAPAGLRILDVAGEPDHEQHERLLLVLDETAQPSALLADEILGRRDLWVQPLALQAPRSCVTGAAMIESGGMALMIDPSRLGR